MRNAGVGDSPKCAKEQEKQTPTNEVKVGFGCKGCVAGANNDDNCTQRLTGNGASPPPDVISYSAGDCMQRFHGKWAPTHNVINSEAARRNYLNAVKATKGSTRDMNIDEALSKSALEQNTAAMKDNTQEMKMDEALSKSTLEVATERSHVTTKAALSGEKKGAQLDVHHALDDD